MNDTPAENRLLRRFERQTTLCVEGLQTALQAVRKKQPAEHALHKFLKTRKQLGGRDRRLIRTVAFCLPRWWGWIHAILPPSLVAVEDQEASLKKLIDLPYSSHAELWKRLLAAVLVLEQETTHEIFQHWLQAEEPQGQFLEEQASLLQKSQVMQRVFGVPELDPEGLFPQWWVDSIRQAMDNQDTDWHTMLEAQQRRPPVWIRLHPDVEPARVLAKHPSQQWSPHPAQPLALSTSHTFNVEELEWHKAGKLEIQDLSSQCVGLICAPRPGQDWWDACAGAGGKSLHLDALMNGAGRILATDVRPEIITELQRRTHRARQTSISARVVETLEQVASTTAFDGVLLDAPCSNTGTWRRYPDARWRTDWQQVLDKAALQLALLRTVAQAVRPGGVLVYSVCSLMPQETTQVVQAFLASHSEFSLLEFLDPLSGQTTPGQLQVWPQQHNSDAMYIARLKKSMI